jgi:homoserine O-succinyltransferase/O-acetyltransferase
MLTADFHPKPLGSGNRHHLVIGLVNNMPDGALDATEHQFRGLLHAATENVSTRLRYFSLPGVPRGPRAQAYVSQYYEDISQLWQGQLDGLIVTGTEPRETVLEDEPYWLALKDLVDQANDRAIPTIWSCLAAHAAVLHMHGIRRRPLREKLSGVFECRKIIDHEIVADAPSRWCVPHSRENDLLAEELISNSYQVVSTSPEVGADTFMREDRTLFIFLQGHLEYDSEALFREYRRDVRRFLAGERSSYPAMPRGYFDAETTAALVAFQEQAMRHGSTEALMQFPGKTLNLGWTWHDLGVRLYANWLSYIVQLHKRAQLPQTAA